MRETLMTMRQVQLLNDEGLSQTAIAERLGIHPETVARYLKRIAEAHASGEPVDSVARRADRAHVIDAYLGHLQTRLKAYPRLSANRFGKSWPKAIPGLDGPSGEELISFTR